MSNYLYDEGFNAGFYAGHRECEDEITKNNLLIDIDNFSQFQDYILGLWFNATNLELSSHKRISAQEKINTLIYKMAHIKDDSNLELPTRDIDLL